MFEVMLGGSNEPKVDSKFIREVPASEFITGAALASQIGLTAGTSQHSDAGWLLFEDSVDGKVKYVAKKPYRHSISWNQINARGAVFGTTIEIDNKTYKVRLLKSAVGGDVYTGTIDGRDPVGAYKSEWNRLFYPVHSGYSSPISGEGIKFGTLVQYTDNDLVVRSSAGNGSASWCQETPSSITTGRIYRGFSDVSYLGSSAASATATTFAWRPVLELVE